TLPARLASPCPRSIPDAATPGDIGLPRVRRTANARLRSGILASIREQGGKTDDVDSVRTFQTIQPLFPVGSAFRVALENAACGKFPRDAASIPAGHQRLPDFRQEQVLGVALGVPDEAEAITYGLAVCSLEPRSTVTLYRRPEVGYRLGDLGGAGAAAVGKPVGKAPAGGSHGLPFRPGKYALC